MIRALLTGRDPLGQYWLARRACDVAVGVILVAGVLALCTIAALFSGGIAP